MISSSSSYSSLFYNEIQGVVLNLPSLWLMFKYSTCTHTNTTPTLTRASEKVIGYFKTNHTIYRFSHFLPENTEKLENLDNVL